MCQRKVHNINPYSTDVLIRNNDEWLPCCSLISYISFERISFATVRLNCILVTTVFHFVNKF